MTTITTTEQADALPVDFVLRLATGRVADRVPDGWTITGIYSPDGRPGVRGLFDMDLPATVLHDPTQPAPAGVNDREAIATAIQDRIKASPIGPPVFGQVGMPFAATMHDLADAVLAVLPGRTVAQVKAEALAQFRVTVADLRRVPGGSHGPSVKGPAGSARREAVERFIAWILSADFEITHAEVVDELEREDKR